MKITFSLEGGPPLIAVASVIASAAAIVTIALAHQLGLDAALQIAAVSGYGQVTAFIVGSRS